MRVDRPFKDKRHYRIHRHIFLQNKAIFNAVLQQVIQHHQLLEPHISAIMAGCYFLAEFLQNVYTNSNKRNGKVSILTVCLETGG